MKRWAEEEFFVTRYRVDHLGNVTVMFTGRTSAGRLSDAVVKGLRAQGV